MRGDPDQHEAHRRRGPVIERGRSAESTPIGTAISIHTTAPPNTSEAVTGAASPTSWFTLSRLKYECPRLKWKISWEEEVPVLVLDRPIQAQVVPHFARPRAACTPAHTPASPDQPGSREEDVADDRDRKKQHDRPQQGGGSCTGSMPSSAAGVERVAEAVAEEVEGEGREQDCEARPEHQPRLGRSRTAARSRAGCPSSPSGPGCRCRGTKARPRPGCTARHDDRRKHDDRRDQVRQQVRADDPRVARADHARGLDELLLAQRQHLGAHDARRVVPAEEADHERRA